MIDNTAILCEKGEEEKFNGKAKLLDIKSLTEALISLNAGRTSCPEGFCVVYSQHAGKYVLLYRRDKKADAFQLLNLIDNDPKGGKSFEAAAVATPRLAVTKASGAGPQDWKLEC